MMPLVPAPLTVMGAALEVIGADGRRVGAAGNADVERTGVERDRRPSLAHDAVRHHARAGAADFNRPGGEHARPARDRVGPGAAQAADPQRAGVDQRPRGRAADVHGRGEACLALGDTSVAPT